MQEQNVKRAARSHYNRATRLYGNRGCAWQDAFIPMPSPQSSHKEQDDPGSSTGKHTSRTAEQNVGKRRTKKSQRKLMIQDTVSALQRRTLSHGRPRDEADWSRVTNDSFAPHLARAPLHTNLQTYAKKKRRSALGLVAPHRGVRHDIVILSSMLAEGHRHVLLVQELKVLEKGLL